MTKQLGFETKNCDLRRWPSLSSNTIVEIQKIYNVEVGVVLERVADILVHVVDVILFGSSGMLGLTVTKKLIEDGVNVIAASRQGQTNPLTGQQVFFDAGQPVSLERLFDSYNCDYVINCAGLIKQRIDAKHLTSVRAAIEVNSIFPHLLNDFSQRYSFRVIQIATDCVFSGERGLYSESDVHDPVDIYGITKSLGEINSTSFLNIRTSIVGRELNSGVSLLEWFLSHKRNAEVFGYHNHHWNGITTFHFAKVLTELIKSGSPLSGTYHLVPGNSVTKYELLLCFSRIFSRTDINVIKTQASNRIDRTLTTLFEDINYALWGNAGYESPPTVEQMIEDYAAWLEGNSNVKSL